jgi:hypothetical protein
VLSTETWQLTASQNNTLNTLHSWGYGYHYKINHKTVTKVLSSAKKLISYRMIVKGLILEGVAFHKNSTRTLVYTKTVISVKLVNVAVHNEFNYSKLCLSILQYVVCDITYK